jgi:hypothetical protein
VPDYSNNPTPSSLDYLAWKKTTIRKLQQLLHPDYVFDDLGLVGITKTRALQHHAYKHHSPTKGG